MKPGQKSPEPWGFFGKQVNRDVIGWFAGGVAAIAMAVWAIFTYDGAEAKKKGPAKDDRPVKIDCEDSACAGRDVHSEGNIIIGPNGPKR
jgi:hypothetical protein